MTDREVTKCLNWARVLNLISSSQTVNGVLHVYRVAGHRQPWEQFISDYPPERLQAMIERATLRGTIAS